MRTNVAASTRAFLERTQEQELVGEAQEAALVTALNQYQGKLGRLFTTWIHRRERSSLPPFGLLEVQCDDHGFVVARNGAPLQHSTCRPGRGSIFLTRQAAQVAAELNMTLGWGSYGREPDCLSFTWSDDSHLGEKHKDGCDVERCPHCGWQALGCAHFQPDDPRRQAWDGKWPGEADWERLGFFVDGNRALPDTTRLFAECDWNPERQRWEPDLDLPGRQRGTD
jgi:hypothetical protein